VSTHLTNVATDFVQAAVDGDCIDVSWLMTADVLSTFSNTLVK